MSDKCEHNWWFECEPSYMPNYQQHGLTCGMGTPFVATVQYECLRCGIRRGWLPWHGKLTHPPVEIPQPKGL